ncbi:MAG: hypothetical protein LC647_06655, partial [Beggiatoa sp.]|nr:hypothetical protein [Beggiatoa sp.]
AWTVFSRLGLGFKLAPFHTHSHMVDEPGDIALTIASVVAWAVRMMTGAEWHAGASYPPPRPAH